MRHQYGPLLFSGMLELKNQKPNQFNQISKEISAHDDLPPVLELVMIG